MTDRTDEIDEVEKRLRDALVAGRNYLDIVESLAVEVVAYPEGFFVSVGGTPISVVGTKVEAMETAEDWEENLADIVSAARLRVRLALHAALDAFDPPTHAERVAKMRNIRKATA